MNQLMKNLQNKENVNRTFNVKKKNKSKVLKTKGEQKNMVIVNISTTKEGEVFVTVNGTSVPILKQVENALRIWKDPNNAKQSPAKNETIEIIFDKVTGEIIDDDDSDSDSEEDE